MIGGRPALGLTCRASRCWAMAREPGDSWRLLNDCPHRPLVGWDAQRGEVVVVLSDMLDPQRARTVRVPGRRAALKRLAGVLALDAVGIGTTTRVRLLWRMWAART
jgi:hypothetical protein